MQSIQSIILETKLAKAETERHLRLSQSYLLSEHIIKTNLLERQDIDMSNLELDIEGLPTPETSNLPAPAVDPTL